jgi:hypothetical protein
MAGGATTARKFNKADRMARCLDMRIQGMSYRAIADQLAKEGIKASYATVANDLVESLKLTQERTAKEAQYYIQLEIERLNVAQAAAMKSMVTGDPQAINAFVKVCESRRKLLGLDAPVQLQIQQGLQSELTSLLEFLQNAVSPEAYAEFMGAVSDLEARSAAATTN